MSLQQGERTMRRRTLPGWSIRVPGQPDEVEAILWPTAAGTGLDYIRLDTSVNPKVVAYSRGLTIVRRGYQNSVTIVAVGPTFEPVLTAPASVLYASTIRPFDAKTQRDMVSSPIVILLAPNLAGTSSAEVSNTLKDIPHRLLALGVDHREHRHYGTSSEHDRADGLDTSGIRHSITDFLTLGA